MEAGAPFGEDVEDEDVAFMNDEEGEVVADLDGQEDDEDDDDDDDDDEEEEAGEGGANGGDGGEEGPSSSAVPTRDDSVVQFRQHARGGSDASVYAVAWHPNRAGVVATGGGDDMAYLWDASFPGAQRNLGAHSDSVSSVAFSQDGTLLATAGLDGKVALWDATAGGTGALPPVRVLEGPGGGVEWVAWHPRGQVVLAGAEDFTCWMWNAADGSCMQVFSGHSGAVTCGGFPPDGRTVVTAGADACLRVWHPRSGECTAVVSGHGFHSGPVVSLAFHPSSPIAITGGEDSGAHLTSLSTGRVVSSLAGHTDTVECVGFSPAHAYAATAGHDGALFVWDAATGQERAKGSHEAGVLGLAWHPTAPVVVTGGMDGSVKVWDARAATCQRTLLGHSQAIQNLHISPPGDLLLTGSDDCSARVWQLDAIVQAIR